MNASRTYTVFYLVIRTLRRVPKVFGGKITLRSDFFNPEYVYSIATVLKRLMMFAHDCPQCF